MHSIYEAAAALDAAERQKYVQAAAPDSDIANRVMKMLDEIEAADDSSLSEPAYVTNTSVRPLLAQGSRLGPYEILDQLGEGGMGVVYRARDPRLDRQVAIKVVSPELAADPNAHARLRREAMAAAALDHPYICKIFEIAEDGDTLFFVMELIAGETLHNHLLNNRMSVSETLRVAGEIAEAIQDAHAGRFLHRDLKPANIMLTLQGHVKVMDFGLAKRIEDRSLSGDAPPILDRGGTELTVAGTVLGTPDYMSPEQVNGLALDTRSDVFSFGVLLYEMLSGRRAFSEKSPISTMGAILHKQPKPLREIAPSVPTALELIVARCIEKNPSARFASMTELKKALKDVGHPSAAPAEVASIAVLPFSNHSSDRENEYFSDGLAEEILIALSRLEGLRVTARSSSFWFKGKSTEMSEIAAKLHVAHILDGSVRRAGNRIRVTVQLVDAHNGFPLWSERYDRHLEDIFEVQDEIARAIADQLKVTLGVAVKHSTTNVEAYELYLKGRHLTNQRLPVTLRQAIQSFEQAIRLDPDFALAYSGLSDCYGILRVYGWISAQEGGPPALAAITKAVAIAPNLWEVIFSRAFYTFYFGRNWRNAGPDFEKAVARNPQSSLAHAYLAIYEAMCRRPDAVITHTTQACKLDPLSPYIHGMVSGAFNVLGMYGKAEIYARKALDLQPSYQMGMGMLGLALSSLGRNQEAIEVLEQVVASSRTPNNIAMLGSAYHRADRGEDANRLLYELEERRGRGEFVPAWSLLSIYAGTRDVAKIREALSEAIAESSAAFTIYLICYSTLSDFCTDPEINSMLVELLG
jgi:serine/threonine protein kinase